MGTPQDTDSGHIQGHMDNWDIQGFGNVWRPGTLLDTWATEHYGTQA